MKINVFILMMCLTATSVMAYNTNYSNIINLSSNTIQVGSASFNCAGYTFTLNNATMNFSNTYNWTLSVPDYNSTNCDYLRGPISNMTDTCSMTISNITKTCEGMVTMMNTSFKYYPLYADCYANLTIALKESKDRDYYENKSNVCETEKNGLQANYQSCSSSLSSCNTGKSDLDTKLKNKNNQIFFAAVVGLGVGAGGMWYMKVKPKVAKSPADMTGRAP